MSVSGHVAELLKKDIVQAMKEGIGFHDSIAEDMAIDILKRIQTRWGGQEVYIPAADSQERNALIRTAFNGRNHAEVCNQYRISLRTLYRIVGE